ncbi:glycosyltransferase family 1 protein [Burkholderia sp. Ac-20345]|uniref:glycosyltransferase family 4 protein n=1 Tax=Burkholderia sp. Ac-20345 TaxID=2703891 RepID=UPI001F12111B|nr:glycosyltransferase family 1 protein [Burkholderia sp. Ac-20345]
MDVLGNEGLAGAWRKMRLCVYESVHRSLLRWLDRWWVPGGAVTMRRAIAESNARPQAQAQWPAQRNLFIDVSIIAVNDAGTGIQRVVRSIAQCLLANPPAGMTVHLVRATRKQPYRYATQYQARLTGQDGAGDERLLEVRRGDVFLGLDLASRPLVMRQKELRRWREVGASCAFVVYDLLPAAHPEWFTPVASKSYRRWLDLLVMHADALFCISKSVAGEVDTWLQDKFGLEHNEIRVDWFHLGADFNASEPAAIGEPQSAGALAAVRASRLVLMVGTVEPRKGHAEMLTAFESAWRDGINVTLVIVGKAGWRVDALVERLKNLQGATDNLVWLTDASDGDLTALYERADGLIMASEAEGFGLPIIEAALRDIPLFLRDIPVFREVAHEHATYFRGDSPAEVAASLERWLRDLECDRAVGSGNMVTLTWEQSAHRLGKLVEALA